METSDTHGPRLDDALAHETESLTSGSPVEARAESGRAMQEGGDDEPMPESIVHLLDDDDPSRLDREEVRARSRLATHLRPSLFPATRDEVIACAVEMHAPPDLLAQLRALQGGIFPNVEAVWEAMGGRRESRGPRRDDAPAAAGSTADESGGTERDGATGSASGSPTGRGGASGGEGAAAEGVSPEELSWHGERPKRPEWASNEPGVDADSGIDADQGAPTGAGSGPRHGQGSERYRLPRRRFAFRFEASYRLAALPFAVDAEHAFVEIERTPDSGGTLLARFGPWAVETPLDNVENVEVTGPYRMIKTIGPPHVSLADGGLTFATNHERGLCITFREPVHGIDPLGVVRHPALTVTVADVTGLRAELEPAP